MTDNRAITWEETDDPNACQSNETVYQLFTRDPVRTPMQWDSSANAGFCTSCKPWLPVHVNYKEVNVAAQRAAEKSTFKFYQRLVELKKHELFMNGDFRSMAVNPSVFAFVRTLEGQKPVTVFINLGGSTVVSLRSLLTTDEIPARPQGRIIAATTKSNYEMNQIVNPDQFELRSFDAIAVQIEEAEVTSTQAPTTTTPGGSAAIASTIALIIAALIVALY
jgi:alpha-glucosidase